MTEFEDRLRSDLIEAVPEAPPAPDRAQSARALARRRRRGRVTVGAGFVVLIAAASAAVALPRLGGSHTGPVGEPRLLACSDIPNIHGLRYPADSEVPAGAVIARLCPANGAQWQPPRDALTSGLDELVADIDDQPNWTQSVGVGPCSFGDRPVYDYTISFGYPDGHVVDIFGELGCSVLRLGLPGAPGGIRTGEDLIIRQYLDQLAEQRSVGTPVETDSPACSDVGSHEDLTLYPASRSFELVAARVCAFRWTEVAPRTFNFVLAGSRPLLDDELVELNAGFVDAEPQEPTEQVGDLLYEIVGVNEWGDRVGMTWYRPGVLVAASTPAWPDVPQIGWRPPQSLQDELFVPPDTTGD